MENETIDNQIQEETTMPVQSQAEPVEIESLASAVNENQTTVDSATVEETKTDNTDSAPIVEKINSEISDETEASIKEDSNLESNIVENVSLPTNAPKIINVETETNSKEAPANQTEPAINTLAEAEECQPRIIIQEIVREAEPPKEIDETEIFHARLRSLSAQGVAKRRQKRNDNLEKIISAYSLKDQFANRDICQLIKIKPATALIYLKTLCRQNRIIRFASGRAVYYRKI